VESEFDINQSIHVEADIHVEVMVDPPRIRKEIAKKSKKE